METYSTAVNTNSSSKPNVFAIIGGVLLLVSFFFPWVEWLVSIPGFKLLSAAGNDAEKLLFAVIWLIPAGGLLSGLLGFAKNRLSGPVSMAIGIVGLAILIWFYLSVSYQLMGKFKLSELGDTFQILGFGVYVAVVGCLVLLGAIGQKSKKVTISQQDNADVKQN